MSKFTQKAMILTLAVSAPACTLAAPTSGELLNQVERSIPATQLPKVSAPKIAPQIARTLSNNGAEMLLKGVRFEGNTVLSSESLLRSIEVYVGEQLSVDDLLLLTDILVQHYAASGFLANVTLPEQDVTDGVVLFRVTEARFGEVLFNADQVNNADIPEDLIRAIVYKANPQREVVVLQQIDRAVLLLGDLGGISADGGLQTGVREGESDLALNFEPSPAIRGAVSVDNLGGPSTGVERLLVTSLFANPFARGGEIDTTALKTEGSEYGGLGYRIPLGYSGMTGRVHASGLNYQVINFPSYRIWGHSTTLGVDINYPYIRAQSENLYLKAGALRSSFKNKIGTAGVVSDYHLDAISIGLDGNTYRAGGDVSYSITSEFGRVDLLGSPNYDDDQNSDKIHGRYAKLNANAMLSMPLASKLDLKLYGEGQLASKNLDSSKQFCLGGSNAVRAFAGSEGCGVAGVRVSADLEYLFSENLVGGFFVDSGHVRQKISNAPVKNYYSLSGYGLSLKYQGPFGVTANTVLAAPIDDNPTSEDEPDNSRFGLTLSVAF